MVRSSVEDRYKASYMKAEIREKVLMMKNNGKDVSHMDDILFVDDTDQVAEMPAPESIDYLLKNWNVQNDYRIFSHRKVIGPVLVYGRKIVNDEINRNVGPLTERQNRLNQLTASVLHSHDSSINELYARMSIVQAGYDKISNALGYMELESISRAQSRISQRIGEIENRLDTIVSAMNSSGNVFNSKVFAETYGGSEDNIKELYTSFVKYYKGCVRVLDIGCGRGYFLDLAADHSFNAYGIDVSADSIDECIKKGRRASQIDAITHLVQLDDASLDGAFMAHVVEHVSHEYLINLLGLLGKKLQPGSPLVIVTPNIRNLSVSACSFYMDPTHKTHIHPDYLEFLLKTNSFDIVEKISYQPTIPASAKLEKIGMEDLPEKDKAVVERLNANIDKLNGLLFGNRDFAIVVKRRT